MLGSILCVLAGAGTGFVTAYGFNSLGSKAGKGLAQSNCARVAVKALPIAGSYFTTIAGYCFTMTAGLLIGDALYRQDTTNLCRMSGITSCLLGPVCAFLGGMVQTASKTSRVQKKMV